MNTLWRRVVTWGVGVAVAGGGVTFCFKLWEFVETASRGDMPGFAFATVVSYFIATAGFLCLAAWAFLRGHYRDIEEPKHRLLDTEARYDRLEARQSRPAGTHAGGTTR
jgi:hypothetical protein